MTPRAAHKLFQVPRFHLSSSWFPKPNHARLEKKPKRREVNKTPRYPEYLDRTPFRLESSLMIFNLSDTIFCLVKIKALTEYWRKISQICCCPNRSQLKQNQMHTTTPKVKHESLVVAANRYAQLRRTGRGWKGRTEGAKSKLRINRTTLGPTFLVNITMTAPDPGPLFQNKVLIGRWLCMKSEFIKRREGKMPSLKRTCELWCDDDSGREDAPKDRWYLGA